MRALDGLKFRNRSLLVVEAALVTTMACENFLHRADAKQVGSFFGIPADDVVPWAMDTRVHGY